MGPDARIEEGVDLEGYAAKRRHGLAGPVVLGWAEPPRDEGNGSPSLPRVAKRPFEGFLSVGNEADLVRREAEDVEGAGEPRGVPVLNLAAHEFVSGAQDV